MAVRFRTLQVDQMFKRIQQQQQLHQRQQQKENTENVSAATKANENSNGKISTKLMIYWFSWHCFATQHLILFIVVFQRCIIFSGKQFRHRTRSLLSSFLLRRVFFLNRCSRMRNPGDYVLGYDLFPLTKILLMLLLTCLISVWSNYTFIHAFFFHKLHEI